MKLPTGLIAIFVMVLCCGTAMAGETLNFALMASKDPAKEGHKYEALSRYIAANSGTIDQIKLKVANDYPHAVKLFLSGDLDGMFAGSFVAAVFVKKGVARPVVRPVLSSGDTTYRALVVARKGTPAFKGLADFEGKKVAYCALASSGEVFARTLLAAGERPEDHYTPVISKSHGAALQALRDGKVDYAVVKNLVWKKGGYPELEVVGGDSEENPNMTLIVTNAVYKRHGGELRKILTGLDRSVSAEARALKLAFGITGFIDTTEESFAHTFDNLQKAHVDPKTFDFAF